MKITEVEIIPMRYNMSEPIYSGTGKCCQRHLLMVRIHTDEGIIGFGESATYGGPMASVATVIEKEIAPMLIGEDPLKVERLWHKCYYSSFQHARSGIFVAAYSGVDIALWDIVGKALGQPIYKLLGGFRSSIPVYASCGFYQMGKTNNDLADEIKGLIDMGFNAVKIKIGRTDTPFTLGFFNPTRNECMATFDQDMDRVRAAKAAVGKNDLMVDANATWDYNTALRAGRIFDELGVYFFEEPVRTDDYEGSAQLARDLDTRIAGYETEYLAANYARIIRMRAVDIVQPDLSWAGGITESRKIAALADANFMQCAAHMFSSAILLAASLQFSCGIPNGAIVEFDTSDNVFRDQLITKPFRPNREGIIELGDEPGLGVELNQDVIDKYRVEL